MSPSNVVTVKVTADTSEAVAALEALSKKGRVAYWRFYWPFLIGYALGLLTTIAGVVIL
jgi:hypothetical protein